MFPAKTVSKDAVSANAQAAMRHSCAARMSWSSAEAIPPCRKRWRCLALPQRSPSSRGGPLARSAAFSGAGHREREGDCSPEYDCGGNSRRRRLDRRAAFRRRGDRLRRRIFLRGMAPNSSLAQGTASLDLTAPSRWTLLCAPLRPVFSPLVPSGPRRLFVHRGLPRMPLRRRRLRKPTYRTGCGQALEGCPGRRNTGRKTGGIHDGQNSQFTIRADMRPRGGRQAAAQRLQASKARPSISSIACSTIPKSS